MRLFGYCGRSLFLPALALVFLLLPKTCSADTYRIVDLGTDAGVFLYGITDAGTVVLNSSLACANSCFDIYAGGAYLGRSGTAPTLAFDDGTPCTPSAPTGFVVEHAICNDGREAFTGYLPPLSGPSGVYYGSDLSDLVARGGEGPLMLNAVGDIVWDDHFSEEIYEAVDLTSPVPEPASWILLGSGALFLLTVGLKSGSRERSSDGR